MTGPTLPLVIEAWRNYCQAHGIGLFDALSQGHDMPHIEEMDEEAEAAVALYFFDPQHDEDFARAWLAAKDANE